MKARLPADRRSLHTYLHLIPNSGPVVSDDATLPIWIARGRARYYVGAAEGKLRLIVWPAVTAGHGQRRHESRSLNH